MAGALLVVLLWLIASAGLSAVAIWCWRRVDKVLPP
jgi:hypothetical protein